MKVQLCTVVLLLSAIFSDGSVSQNPSQEDDAVFKEYILTGTVMDDESALNALKREAMFTYQLNFPKYLEEFPEASIAEIQNHFEDKDFAVVGSLATVDASIVFGEGIKNLQVIAAEQAAGFSGRPNPMNDQLHNRLQRLNAFRNLLWLLKEKLRSGVVTVDASLMEKLREAQTWLSTQTGGHLGQAMTSAFEGSGLMAKLEAKWGRESLKFRSFSAAAANGLDFAINGFNSVVNAIALDQEVTDANILSLTSSLSAMAGDVTMGVTQILSTGAKAASAAGPIGYGIAATLYIASYATGVASGLVGDDDLEDKDYVKAFLSPLIPSPDFAAMVDLVDAAAKGNILKAYTIYLTQSMPAALAMGGMAIVDGLTGSTYLKDHLSKLSILFLMLEYQEYSEKYDEYQAKVKEKVRELVQKIKPKKFLYAYPTFNSDTGNDYSASGWRRSATLKAEFEITSQLSNWIVFMATYTSNFPKPNAYPNDREWGGQTFVPQVVNHGLDPFLFLGSNSMNDTVYLDTNTEAYGLGGNDSFYVMPSWGSNTTGTVRIDGGPGSDHIYTTSAYEGTECFLTGGGPERDFIHGGNGNDFIYVENDTVSDSGGENTILVAGSGDDNITVGAGTDVIIINKTSGSIRLKTTKAWNQVWKARRIVYQGDALTSAGTINQGLIRLSGGRGHHDVLSMTKYQPKSLPSNPSSFPERLIVLQCDYHSIWSEYNNISFFFNAIRDVVDHLFENTRCTVNTNSDPPVFCPEADESQRIYYEYIERFELSKNTSNLLLLSSVNGDVQGNVRHEIIGGPYDDYVINYNTILNFSLIAQMGGGANRVHSLSANDFYSLILDEKLDIIYDSGGENLVAIMLPEEVSFGEVYIGQNEDGDSFKVYYGEQESTKQLQFQYIFNDEPNRDHKVQFLFKESTGKEIVFNKIGRPSYWPWDNAYHDLSTPTIDEIYSKFREGGHWPISEMIESTTPATVNKK